MSTVGAGSGAPRRALRIGLTGPIGCGKSTVARWLSEQPGVVLIDADEIARAVRREPEVAQRIAQRFGTAEPAALARMVFSDDVALRDLEAIVHPAVRPRILAAIAQADAGDARAVVIEAIKLVEGGLAEACDEVWLITCSAPVQRVRLLGRGMAPDDADQRIGAQGDLAARLAPYANRTIDTSGDAEEARAHVIAALDDAIARSDRAEDTLGPPAGPSW
jgi:dephospho-CoA kinase